MEGKLRLRQFRPIKFRGNVLPDTQIIREIDEEYPQMTDVYREEEAIPEKRILN